MLKLCNFHWDVTLARSTIYSSFYTLPASILCYTLLEQRANKISGQVWRLCNLEGCPTKLVQRSETECSPDIIFVVWVGWERKTWRGGRLHLAHRVRIHLLILVFVGMSAYQRNTLIQYISKHPCLHRNPCLLSICMA